MGDVQVQIQEAKTLFENLEYEDALPLLLNISKKKNGKAYADVHNMLGVISHQSGQFGDAMKHFENALKVNANYTEAMMNLAVLYNDLGKYPQARKLFDKVKAQSKAGTKDKSKMDPNIRNKIANKHNEVGDMYQGIGFYKEAVIEYDKALKLAPKFWDIRIKRAICLREAKKYAEALKEFSQIMKENPKLLVAKVQRGVTLYTQGKVKEAIKEWKSVSKSDPDNESAEFYLKLAGAA